MIETDTLQGFQVFFKIKIEIDHCAVMFSGGNQYCRLVFVQKIMGIFRVQGNRCTCRYSAADGEYKTNEQIQGYFLRNGPLGK